MQADTQNATVILPYYDNSVRYILGPADMTGNGVSNASVQLSTAGQYSVVLTFTNAGGVQFDKIAAQRYPYYQQDPSNPPSPGPGGLRVGRRGGVRPGHRSAHLQRHRGDQRVNGRTFYQ